MKQYTDMLEEILIHGHHRGDRTGTGTISKFGHQLRFDLNEGFPLLTLKRVPFKSLSAELIAFIRGITNAKEMNALGTTIWDEWALLEDNNITIDPEHALYELTGGHPNKPPVGDVKIAMQKAGDLGPIYSKQWRAAEVATMTDDGPDIIEVDQLFIAAEMIKNNPLSRRNIVSAWNPGFLPEEIKGNQTEAAQINIKNGKMALPPCHVMFQFYVDLSDGEDNPKLCCHMFQRSWDVFLGAPFNIASYAALIHLMANYAGIGVGELLISATDVHIYMDHVDAVKTLLAREEKPLPTFTLPKEIDFTNATVDDLVNALDGYSPHPNIPAKVAV